MAQCGREKVMEGKLKLNAKLNDTYEDTAFMEEDEEVPMRRRKDRQVRVGRSTERQKVELSLLENERKVITKITSKLFKKKK